MKSYDLLIENQKKNNTCLCVGLDTELFKLPTSVPNVIGSMVHFNCSIIDATKDLVCSYKINFAFYEQYGVPGIEVLKKTFDYVPKDILTIADAKRADIGNTSAAYARSCFDYFGAGAVTVNPYMGRDSIQPFLDYKDKLVFILGLTSNPGSNDFQRLKCEDASLYKKVVSSALNWGDDRQVGFVVGATHPEQIEELREIAPNNVFLIPGIGTQGGDIEATLNANHNCPAIVNVSRAIIYASNEADYIDKVRAKAEYYQKQLVI